MAAGPVDPVTFTGAIGAVCNYPLRLIIAACVRLRIHPNVLTFTGVVINGAAGWALAHGQFGTAGGIMIVANIFDFIDGKVAIDTGAVSKFGGFWDSVIDRFSDLALSVGLIWLYASLGRTDYVLDYLDRDGLRDHDELHPRARRVAHPQVQGRIHGAARADRALHDRRLHQSHGRRHVGDRRAVDRHGRRPHLLHLSRAEPPAAAAPPGVAGIFWRAFYWTDERATVAYDLWVIAILAFVWLTPPGWIGDPMAAAAGWFIQWLQWRR